MADQVAVVIPARGEEPFLTEAVDSALRQPEVSQVVVASHEPDSATARLVEAHVDRRVRHVVSQGPSAGENLDAGVAVTTAPLLSFLDADDTWPPGRLGAMLGALAATPDAELCRGRQQAMSHDGSLLPAVALAPLLGAVLVRRTAALRVGGFGAGLVAQMRWLLRAAELGVVAVELPDVVLHRRAHDGNLSRTHRPELHRAYLDLARERARRASREEGT